jgi:hypothetical protein
MGVEGVSSTPVYNVTAQTPEVAEPPGQPDRDGDGDDNAIGTTTAEPVKSPTPPQVGSQVDISA